LAAALSVTRLFSSLLSGTEQRIMTYAGAAVLLCLVALPASYLPARRAKVEPMEALRFE
jgi:ABC-type lipoprotein release transport system permease subunit